MDKEERFSIIVYCLILYRSLDKKELNDLLKLVIVCISNDPKVRVVFEAHVAYFHEQIFSARIINI